MFREGSALRSTSPVHWLYTARWYGMRLPHGYEELTSEVTAVLGERKVKSRGVRCQKGGRSLLECDGSDGSVVNSQPTWSGKRRQNIWEIGREAKPSTKRHPKLVLGLNGTCHFLFRPWYGLSSIRLDHFVVKPTITTPMIAQRSSNRRMTWLGLEVEGF